MELANLSPKQLRELSLEIARLDERLAEFLSSLQTTVTTFPVDEGAFRDDLFMLGKDLFKAGVLRAAGPSWIAHALETVSGQSVGIFLEGVDQEFAEQVKREIAISKQMAKASVSTTMPRGTEYAPVLSGTNALYWEDYAKALAPRNLLSEISNPFDEPILRRYLGASSPAILDLQTRYIPIS